jgi:microcystin-dependent protein
MVNINIKEGVDTLSSVNSYIPTGSLITKASPASSLTNYDTDAKCISAGFIPCDGRTLNATLNSQYLPLYNVIGILYGGSGMGAFLVPNLRTSRRYIYGQPTAVSGVYTPSFSANVTNAVTHSHTVSGMSGQNLSTNAANISAGVGGRHSHSISFTPAAANADHYHGVNYNVPGFTVGQALGTTLTKSDGTGTAAGAAHTHTHNAINVASNTNADNMTHGHDAGSGTTNVYDEPTHTHTIPSSNVSIPVSSAIDIPYISVLYFIKI